MATERIGERREKAGGRGGAMIVTDFRDERRHVVAQARSTLIERSPRVAP